MPRAKLIPLSISGALKKILWQINKKKSLLSCSIFKIKRIKYVYNNSLRFHILLLIHFVTYNLLKLYAIIMLWVFDICHKSKLKECLGILSSGFADWHCFTIESESAFSGIPEQAL